MQRSATVGSLLSILSCAALVSCSHEEKPAPKESPIRDLPATLRVTQRSTAVVPGSDDKLSLTIDDITRGQVMVGLAEASGAPVLAMTSLTDGKSTDFTYAGSRFTLRLKLIENALVGDDFATFSIEAATGGATEADRIEKLISHVEGLKDVTFVRNGKDHTPSDAAKLLRHKHKSMSADVTAEQFIVEAGTKSSTSGQPYEIRHADGRTVPSADFLREQLKEIEKK